MATVAAYLAKEGPFQDNLVRNLAVQWVVYLVGLQTRGVGGIPMDMDTIQVVHIPGLTCPMLRFPKERVDLVDSGEQRRMDCQILGQIIGYLRTGEWNPSFVDLEPNGFAIYSELLAGNIQDATVLLEEGSWFIQGLPNRGTPPPSLAVRRQAQQVAGKIISENAKPSLLSAPSVYPQDTEAMEAMRQAAKDALQAAK